MYKTRHLKYNNKKTTFNGRKFDSKHEAGVAQELELRKCAGDILDYECQYKVDMDIFDCNGRRVDTISHKVDFRVHNHDGSFTLVEAKGVETPDYKFRRKMLERIFLPLNPDHEYEIIYLKNTGWRTRPKRG